MFLNVFIDFIGTDDPCSTVSVCVRVCACLCKRRHKSNSLIFDYNEMIMAELIKEFHKDRKHFFIVNIIQRSIFLIVCVHAF